ncbi:acyl-coenzyme A synthetase ACSM3, mitochondrial-like [Watersipora subatra]|uniref:acyl-coenzyme A synthetase ACSM3, mitochondrial-like n=1 Tax=Watersipora subatra TaxID=2589382 RepID=UPI00355C513A
MPVSVIKRSAAHIHRVVRWSRCCLRSVSRTNFTDYEKERQAFKLDAPEYFNFSRDIFDVWTLKKPELTALWWIDEHGKSIKYSYSVLSQLSKRLANGLQAGAGLERGSKVLVILPRIVEWWILTLACIRAGVVFCPGTTLLTAKDVAWRLEAAAVDAVIVTDGDVHKIEEISASFPQLKKICVARTCPQGWYKLDDLLSKGSADHTCVNTYSSEMMNLFFTSGTTGAPKMAQHTHASYGLGHIITGRYWLNLVEGDVVWSNNDTGWAKTAFSNTFGPWSMGATVFTQHTAKFDPSITLKVLSDYPITTLCAPPTGYRLLVQENIQDFKLKALSHSVSAGEPLNPEVLDKWKAMTELTIMEGYGQTETVLVCGNFKCLPVKLGSMGKASPGFDLKIVNKEGVEMEPHKEGELAISVAPKRPVGLFPGYLNDEDKTNSVFVNGFYLTGDRAFMDEEGYFWFVGRSDDVIISAGYRIGPFEVESALLEHPAVLESAVVASPDSVRGQVVKAYVILTQSAKQHDKDVLTRELQNHVKSVTAPYKYPRQIEFTEQLPKTVSGKIRRVELREREINRGQT